MDFGLNVDETRPAVTVVAVNGEVDVSTAPMLRTQLADLVRDGKQNLIVNLTAVEFIDSTGLGVLVSAVKRVRPDGGDLALVCVNPHMLKVLEITGLTTVLAVHTTLDAALAG